MKFITLFEKIKEFKITPKRKVPTKFLYYFTSSLRAASYQEVSLNLSTPVLLYDGS